MNTGSRNPIALSATVVSTGKRSERTVRSVRRPDNLRKSYGRKAQEVKTSRITIRRSLFEAEGR